MTSMVDVDLYLRYGVYKRGRLGSKDILIAEYLDIFNARRRILDTDYFIRPTRVDYDVIQEVMYASSKDVPKFVSPEFPQGKPCEHSELSDRSHGDARRSSPVTNRYSSLTFV